MNAMGLEKRTLDRDGRPAVRIVKTKSSAHPVRHGLLGLVVILSLTYSAIALVQLTLKLAALLGAR